MIYVENSIYDFNEFIYFYSSNNQNMRYTILFLLGVIIASCSPLPDNDLVVTGMEPIYIQENDFKDITSEAAKSFGKVGKIYKQGNYIFISDRGTGVHVINNADPSNPQKVGFINIPGNNDMLARASALYADNGKDFVTIDISDLANAHEVNRIENVYPNPGDQSPPNYSGYFECVDPANGIAIDWKEVELVNPKCKK